MLDNNYTKQEVANFTEVQLSIIYDWIKTRKDLEKNNYYGLKRGNPVIVDNLKVHHAKIIQKRPKKIMSYFKHENLTYI